MTDAADTRDGAGSGRSARTVLTLIGIGLFAGFLSGLFGVGGGIVIVPALVLLAGYNQRLAAGTSLAAIVPTATVGVISYATSGAVLWLPALVLAAAAVVGAQIGTSLAPRIPQRILQWGFVVFLVAVIVSLFLVIPSRDGVFEITVVSGIGLVVLGMITGTLSGLLGVGGGIVIVPALVLLAGYNQRLAAGTSLAAIVPTATVGVISYATSGAVLWLPALVLAAAAVVGAQIGTSLAPRIPQRILQWGFVVFLVAVIVSLFLVIPSRDGVFEITVVSGIGLVVLGMITGTLSGLLGVGGGIIVVPMLVLLFGVSDLAAKGTSLLMMIPTALSGTVGNLRNKNVDIVAALLIGGAACTTTALGAWLSKSIDPMTGNIVFAVFLLAVGARMALQALRNRY